MSAEQAKELREDILPAIDKARQALSENSRPEFTRLEEVAKAAGHGVATWHAWRRHESPTSPKFFDLRDFARAVGLDVRLLGQDASQSIQPGRPNLKPETLEVVKWMEGLPVEARTAVKDAALAKIMELAARPPEAVAESSQGSRARSK